MVAHVEVPGSVHHVWRRFTGPDAREAASEWIDAKLIEMHERHPAGRFSCGILTEADAARITYLDGTKAYPADSPGNDCLRAPAD